MAALAPATSEAWIVMGVLAILLPAWQQWRISKMSRRFEKREELFRIVTENAADMIALVDVKGKRLYNSPAYKRILGYSQADLGETSGFEQIHPEDRYKVLEAAREAHDTGIGKSLQYRIRHKNGNWLILESTASTIRNEQGEVTKLVIVNRDITERKHAEEQLERNSFHDNLTGLPNRRLLLDRLERSFVRAQRDSEYRYALLFVDVDGFRGLNEKMGSAVGDQVITEISQRLGSCLREDDTVSRPKGKLPVSDAMLSRLGGDEFTILLEETKDPSDAMRVAKRMQAALSAPLLVGDKQIRLSASVGIAVSRVPQARAEDLLQEAETALHRAKALGGSRCEVFDEGMHTSAMSRLKLEAELRAAMEQDQFRVHYQPIVRLETNQIAGFEALVRWHHPEQGLISPYKFIEAAEDTGLLVSIGNWVIRQACLQMRVWQSKYDWAASLSITLNLSAKQFCHSRLVSDIKATIHETGIEPERLQLEATEKVAMADPKTAFHTLSQLKQLGVRIGIDDFGTGFSSLTWLRRFPIDVFKIDRSLVSAMLTERASGEVVQMIVTLANSWKLQLVAEGVEDASQLNRLKKLGCEFAQGYLFSQPLEAERAEKALRPQSLRATPAGAR